MCQHLLQTTDVFACRQMENVFSLVDIALVHRIKMISDIAADELPLLRLLHEESMFMPTTMQALWDFALDTFAESRYLLFGMRCFETM